jgi:hypothetical protein
MTPPTVVASRSESDIDPSAERFSKPTELGQPCWSPEAIGRSITSVARLDPKLSHYFLAGP